MKLPSAYILSNNGLGDNILMIGAIHFLLEFYDTIFFLCKDTNYPQIYILYKNNPNVNVIQFDSKNERDNCVNILYDKYINNDVFICGCIHTLYLSTKITHPALQAPFNENSSIKLPTEYDFINDFYNPIGLNLSIFINYFNIETNNDLYEKIKKYDFVFLHTDTSIGHIGVPFFNDMIENFMKNNMLIICPNKNVYPINHPYYQIANEYVFLPTVFDYIDIIKNAYEIYVTDSCFSCIILPLYYKTILFNNQQLKCKNPIIYSRITKNIVNII